MIVPIPLEFLHDGTDGFELLTLYMQIDGKGVKHADHKRAVMLHTAGLSVQDIFFTLDEGTCENNYLKAKDALDKYLQPKANNAY